MKILFSIIALAIIATILAPTAAFASSNNDDKEVNLSGGKLTIKKADDITINISGQPGEKGDKGDPGQNGIDGQDGVDGKDGINGTNGSDGLNGRDGINGTDGTTLSNETLSTISQLESQAQTLATVYDLYQNGSLGNISICYTQEGSTDCLPIGNQTNGGNGTVVNPPVDNGTVTNPPVDNGTITEPPIDNGTSTGNGTTTEPPVIVNPPVDNGTSTGNGTSTDGNNTTTEPPVVIIPDNGTNTTDNGTVVEPPVIIDVPSNETPIIIDEDVNVTN